MFKKLSSGSASSSEGYFIKVEHHTLIYKEENGFIANFEIEDEINPFCLIIYMTTLNTWIKANREKITDDKKKVMLQQIDKTLIFLNIEHKFK